MSSACFWTLCKLYSFVSGFIYPHYVWYIHQGFMGSYSSLIFSLYISLFHDHKLFTHSIIDEHLIYFWFRSIKNDAFMNFPVSMCLLVHIWIRISSTLKKVLYCSPKWLWPIYTPDSSVWMFHIAGFLYFLKILDSLICI